MNNVINLDARVTVESIKIDRKDDNNNKLRVCVAHSGICGCNICGHSQGRGTVVSVHEIDLDKNNEL